MLILIIRTLILYFLVMIFLRLMGKQQISQLQPFEFVTALMISELATIPMENVNAPLLYGGVVPVITILTAQLALGYLSLKSNRFRKLISGAPTVLIYNGEILQDQLAHTRYTLNDLIEQLRIKDYPNIGDISYAILETNGDLSVILKSEKQPVTLEDLSIATMPASYPAVLILDGQLQKDNLKQLDYPEEKLMKELKKQDILLPCDAFIAILDTKGTLFAQKKEEAKTCAPS